MKASPTTAKDSAVLTSSFVMEVSSIMKGGMGFVGLKNLEKKASSILTPEQSKNYRVQLNDFVPLPTSSSCFKIKNNIKDTSPINVGSIIISHWDQRRGGIGFLNIVLEIWTVDRSGSYWSGCSCGNSWVLSTVVA
jgi:hypothetical protein